jgi:site-specific recombinase XerD
MPYQYVREPLTVEESDRLSNACETPTERLVVWTLLDTRLRVSELCVLSTKNVLWQQRQLRVKGKGGPRGKKTKVRVVPMSNRVRALQRNPGAEEQSARIMGVEMTEANMRLEFGDELDRQTRRYKNGGGSGGTGTCRPRG